MSKRNELPENIIRKSIRAFWFYKTTKGGLVRKHVRKNAIKHGGGLPGIALCTVRDKQTDRGDGKCVKQTLF